MGVSTSLASPGAQGVKSLLRVETQAGAQGWGVCSNCKPLNGKSCLPREAEAACQQAQGGEPSSGLAMALPV